MMTDVRVVILAAGDGKRMQSDLPKALHLLHGVPLIEHVVSAVEKAGLPRPIVVVSSKHTKVQDYLAERADYVIQTEQLGTGHAVLMAEEILKDCENVVVLYVDMPFIRASTLLRLIERHREKNNTVTLMTTTVPNFSGVYLPFQSFSRIVRGVDGQIVRDVQYKDATPHELLIHECNPSVYCFKGAWLWSHLKNLKNNNAQKEYYLTDLIAAAIVEKISISSIAIDPHEAVGISTKADLELAQNVF